MKILNCYAGIGGNRKLWGDSHQVTAVEMDEEIAGVYADLYPGDDLIVGDAHSFLLENFADFDMVWTSPPCPSHGQYRHNVGVKAKGFDPIYPDMKLYEEIILLKHHFGGAYVVENTRSYYEPLIAPQVIARHYFWLNFFVPNIRVQPSRIGESGVGVVKLETMTGFDLSTYDIKSAKKRTMLRNCVNSQLGLHVFNYAMDYLKADTDTSVSQMVMTI